MGDDEVVVFEDIDSMPVMADTFVPLAERVEQVEMLAVAAWPPVHATLVAEFVVVGEPRPAGSKSSIPAVRKDPKKPGRFIPILKENGVPVVRTVDSSGTEGVAWRQDVSSAGLHWRRTDAPIAGRLAAEFTFVFPYKAGDYMKRDPTQLKGSIRVAPHVRPDVLKLTRAAEDALTSVIYEDDAQITDELSRKVHVAPSDGPMRLEVRVWTLPTTHADLRELVGPEGGGPTLFG